MSHNDELYQQVILDHNRKPRNFGKLASCTNSAEGFNPVCGDHLWVYMVVADFKIDHLQFEGSGCAISKASASMMTEALKGKSEGEARVIFSEFQRLLKGELNPEKNENQLGRLRIFSGIWKYPARVKCAALAWHAMHEAIGAQKRVSTE